MRFSSYVAWITALRLWTLILPVSAQLLCATVRRPAPNFQKSKIIPFFRTLESIFRLTKGVYSVRYSNRQGRISMGQAESYEIFLGSIGKSIYMFNDLELAISAVDWVVASLPSLKERLNLWLKANYKTKEVEIAGNPTHNLLVAYEVEPFPLAFSVEFGAYLNVLRSALDILACAIAARQGVTQFEEVYFPVAKNAYNWANDRHKGAKFLHSLTASERAIIDSYKPYNGGDPDIWALHKLDIERKHRRLLTAEPTPAMFVMWHYENEHVIDLKAPFGVISANGETALCFVPKEFGDRSDGLNGQIFINEPTIPFKAEALSTLNQFSNKVREIILAFKT
jgi:hypothetical protein